MKVYLCEDSICGIFSGIYDGWTESKSIENALQLNTNTDQQLFCEYLICEPDQKKSLAVERMITRNLGDEAYWHFYHALLSEDPDKADAVFQTMKVARTLRSPSRIMQHLTNPHVTKVFQLSRNVGNEADRYIEFVRFKELANGILLSEIHPSARILTCLGDHFANRFPLENWVIYDDHHQESLVHKAGKGVVLVTGEALQRDRIAAVSQCEQEYQKLWKGFFQTIAIKERTNPSCQQNHLPKKMRSYMTEFDSNL